MNNKTSIETVNIDSGLVQAFDDLKDAVTSARTGEVTLEQFEGLIDVIFRSPGFANAMHGLGAAEVAKQLKLIAECRSAFPDPTTTTTSITRH